MATLSGSATTAYESQIDAGGTSLLITLTTTTWAAEGATFDSERSNINNGITGDGSWIWVSSEIESRSFVDIVRTSDTVVTISLPSPTVTYSIASNETVSVSVPGTAVTELGGEGPDIDAGTFIVQEGSPPPAGAEKRESGWQMKVRRMRPGSF